MLSCVVITNRKKFLSYPVIFPLFSQLNQLTLFNLNALSAQLSLIIYESNDSSDFTRIFVVCVCLCIIHFTVLPAILMIVRSRSDLADLVEIIHKVVKLMDHLQSRGTLRVSYDYEFIRL